MFNFIIFLLIIYYRKEVEKLYIHYKKNTNGALTKILNSKEQLHKHLH